MLHLKRLCVLALFALGLAFLGNTTVEATRRPSQTPVFVDTDIGVDDAVAIAWLLRQNNVKVVGFTTVSGNTTVDNAARNLLTLLDTANRETIPVTVGASDPLSFPRTRVGAMIHGPDGFWFQQAPKDISSLPTDAAAALAAAARSNPGLTIIALGPLTNLALAIDQYPNDMAGVRLVALGGGTHGNQTPVAEFNIYADPQALDVVLNSDMDVELVTLDAFEQVTVDSERFPEKLARRGGDVGQLLAPMLSTYFQTTTQGAGGDAAIPDVAAVIYALNAQYGEPFSALVKVQTGDDYGRGQTIIADTTAERVGLIATDEELSELADQAFTPGFDLNIALYSILQREPDNAQVILDVQENFIVGQLERSLTR